MDEVRLEGQLLLRDSERNELGACELRKGDVLVDHRRPGPEHVMQSDHRGYNSRSGPTVPVASMGNAGPCELLPETVLAHFSVPEKGGYRTSEPVVVECLDHRGPLGLRRIVSGRRDQR